MDAIESNEEPTKEECGSSTEESEDEVTDEQRRLYDEHVLKSDGFDVPDMPGIYSFHLIKPYDITVKTKNVNFERFSQHAVDQYNRRFKKAKAKLEFVKVLKAMVQPAANAVMFYITFDAKDLANGGKIKTYQTSVVLMKVGWKMSVLSFRLKPDPEDEQGCKSGEIMVLGRSSLQWSYTWSLRRFFRGDMLTEFN